MVKTGMKSGSVKYTSTVNVLNFAVLGVYDIDVSDTLTEVRKVSVIVL